MAEFGKSYTRRIFSEVGGRARRRAGPTADGLAVPEGREDERGRRPARRDARNVTKLVDGLEKEGLLTVNRTPRPAGYAAPPHRKGPHGFAESMAADFATAAKLYERLSAPTP